MRTLVSCEDSGQLWHPDNLVTVFAVSLKKTRNLMYLAHQNWDYAHVKSMQIKSHTLFFFMHDWLEVYVS